jgi:hypothetical protein
VVKARAQGQHGLLDITNCKTTSHECSLSHECVAFAMPQAWRRDLHIGSNPGNYCQPWNGLEVGGLYKGGCKERIASARHRLIVLLPPSMTTIRLYYSPTPFSHIFTVFYKVIKLKSPPFFLYILLTSSYVVGNRRPTRYFKSRHTFSIGFRSGLFAGQTISIFPLSWC